MGVSDEAVVVWVGVRDEHPEQGPIAVDQTRYRWHSKRLLEADVERAPDIEHDATAVVLNLDAAATDLTRAAMYPNPYSAHPRRGRTRGPPTVRNRNTYTRCRLGSAKRPAVGCQPNPGAIHELQHD